MVAPPIRQDEHRHEPEKRTGSLQSFVKFFFGLIVIATATAPLLAHFVSIESSKWTQQASTFETTNGVVAKVLIGAGYDTGERTQYQTFVFFTKSDGILPRLVTFSIDGGKVGVEESSVAKAVAPILFFLASWAVVFWYSLRLVRRLVSRL